MIPSVQVQKQDFQTGVTPTDEGILALVSTSDAGDINVPAGFTDGITLQAEEGDGRLTEYGSLYMANSGKPLLAVKGDPTTLGSYGTVTHTGTGTGAWTATASTHPSFSADVTIKILNDGTEGVAGIKWQWSIDGENFSPIITQSTSADFAIPHSGISFTLGTGTVVAGDTVTCSVVGPVLSTTDIATSLEALRVTKAEWDLVLVDTEATSTIVSQLDTWLEGLEAVGVFKCAALRTRPRALDGSETEAQYATAMQTEYGSSQTIRAFVGADQCDMVSVSPNFGGNVLMVPFVVPLCARILSQSEEVDPAQVNLGALGNVAIDDANQNPKYHDEAIYPGLDDLRLATARTFQGPSAPSGVFVNNCPMLSSTGSDYVYVQHARIMNKACTIAYALLLQRLSIGVRSNPNTGFILEIDALEIEQAVQLKLQNELTGKVSGVTFKLSRTDDLSSNAGATINCTLSIASLKYIKTFKVKAKFASQ